MSTFDGIVREFPFIQIDYFRKNPERPPPLACFLSHVHSDHLQGLESFRAPFIYCSTATREVLLRIEKYPHRMNFNNGVLESRRLHYKHLSKLLRPIPLDTPTEIDLTPRLSIRVTLLDANHCTGAVMFLIEGDGKAVLYTGDIRAESWWVNALVRHPILIPYTLGNKRIDKLYLDTTFAKKSDSCYRFPSKAEGIAELLQKVDAYPQETIFYFRAWTFGYEDVWVALSAAFKAKIHVDRYQLGIYKSLASLRERSNSHEIPCLCGFELGNRVVPGCLSEDAKSRIHSCEPGLRCPALHSIKTVYIVPIVNRMKDGSKVPEIGAGGGRGDLYQVHELELPDISTLEKLDQLCRERIRDHQALSKARQAIFEAFRSTGKSLSLDNYGVKDAHCLPLVELVNILSRGYPDEKVQSPNYPNEFIETHDIPRDPPGTIYFPYSRHSSYIELCELVSALRPKDIYPCTVDPLNWDEEMSMEKLFGHFCSSTQFVHDEYMREITKADDARRSKKARYDVEYLTQSSQRSSRVTNSDTDLGSSQSFASQANPQTNDVNIDLVANLDPGNLPLPAVSHALRSDTDISIFEEKARADLSSSAPSSDRLRLPSSLETIEDPNHSALLIPPASPETLKARKDAIRQAWHTLGNSQAKGRLFEVGPLPSSWSTDEEGHKIDTNQPPEVKEKSAREHFASHPLGTNEPPTQGSLESSLTSNTTINENATTLANPIVQHSSEFVTDIDIDQDGLTHNRSSQQSHTLSISSSAFASQEPESLDRDSRPQGEELIHDYDDTHQNSPDSSPSSSPNIRRNFSSRNRKAAYLAARADSYDAWASLSLISAGNNHTEEEIEL